MLNELRASHPKYDKSIKFILIDWDTFSSHSVTSSRNIPRRSTLVLIKDSKEIGRLVADTDETVIKEFLDNSLK